MAIFIARLITASQIKPTSQRNILSSGNSFPSTCRSPHGQADTAKTDFQGPPEPKGGEVIAPDSAEHPGAQGDSVPPVL